MAICAVAGMGGVGKTELATQYARTYEADYPGGICWLNARESNLGAQIVLFAQSKMNLDVPQKLGDGSPLKLEEKVEWCWQNWQPADGVVLVVLDDVTDLRSCRRVLPTANRFRILMTTRQRRLDPNFVELPLDVLSRKAALELLTALEGEGRVEWDVQIAQQLSAWLGYLPLGLELVGRYLAEDPDLSLAEMLERLKAQRLQDEAIDLDEQQLQNTFSTAQRGVRAAFELSWQELAPITQRVGQLLSLFTPTVIPWEIVKISRQMSCLNWTEVDINLAKKQLHRLHFLQRIEEKESCYKIHPLMRAFLQGKLENSHQADTFKKTFLEGIDKFKQKQASEILAQNLDIIAEKVAEEFQELEFDEQPRHPKDIYRLDFLEEITVTVESVTVIKQSLLYVSDDFLESEVILEIVFTPEGSYPDQDMGYYDSEEGEWCTLNTITAVGVQNTQTLTVKVTIIFDENDPLDTNEVDDVEFVDGISLVKMRK